MKLFFKILLIIFGLFALGLAIFVVIRIRENDRQAALRLAEAEKNQVSQAEAQQLDLGGFKESDFRLLPEPPAGSGAPTPEQWREVRQALSGALPDLLPLETPVVSLGFGPIRYALRPDSWRLLVDCRREAPACAPLTLALSTLSSGEADEVNESINLLAREGTVEYGAVHGRKGTEGMDKLIREGNVPMIYNEFCSELGCNGSVSFTAADLQIKIEGSGDLQPWFSALARTAVERRKR